MSYIGNNPISVSFPTDTFSGTGSQTAFTLQLAPASTNSVIVAVSGVVQDPSTYSLSGTTLTFSAAPPAGTSNISVRFLGVPGIPNTPTAGSVTNSSFSNTITKIPFASGESLGAGNASIMKNRIINGAMVIDQRNAGASVTNTTSEIYTVDRWSIYGAVGSKFTAQQNAGSVTPPVGFTKYLGITSSSANTPGSTDQYYMRQSIEGFNIADLGWGTANAKTVTLSFQVCSSLTGTFGGSLTNLGYNRSYPFSFSIPVANTWTSISITIAGDTTGTWNTDNTRGISVFFNLGSGSSQAGTAGAWAATGYFSATGAVNILGTNGATFYITGVQLEVGSSATGYEYRQYQQELALCQRYFWKNFPGVSGASLSSGGAFGDTSSVVALFKFPVDMRASPTVIQSNTSVANGAVGATTSALGASALGVSGGYQIVTGSTASFSAGNGGYVYATNSSGYIQFSAEL